MKYFIPKNVDGSFYADDNKIEIYNGAYVKILYYPNRVVPIRHVIMVFWEKLTFPFRCLIYKIRKKHIHFTWEEKKYE